MLIKTLAYLVLNTMFLLTKQKIFLTMKIMSFKNKCDEYIEKNIKNHNDQCMVLWI